jgi:hypothetical protein
MQADENSCSKFEDFGYLRKKAAHGDMSRLGGRGILIF